MNLFKKFIEFALGNGIVLILGFLSSPIITRIISPEEMGKFSMFNTVVNLLLLVVLLGVDQSYVRYYYEEEKEGRIELLRNCIIIPILVNIVVGVAILFFYKPISIYVIDKASFTIAVLIIIHLTGSIISRFSLLQVRMQQKAKLFSLLNILNKASYLLLVGGFYFIYKNNSLTLIMAIVCSNMIVAFIGIFVERKTWFNFKVKNKMQISKSEIIRYGVPFVFSMAVTWIFQSIDRISIKQFCGYTEVGLYSGAMSIISLLNAVQSAFTTFWVPVAYERYSKDKNDTEFFTNVNKIVSVVMLLLAIGLIVSKDLLVLLLGPKYREAMFIFPYLVFMPIMYTISETTVLGINFKKKTKAHIYIAVISAVFNIIGNMVLVPKYGAKGAAISTGLAYIVFFSIRTYLSNKYYNVDYNIKKFAICTFVTYTLAAYSSFYNFNLIIFILAIISIVVIVIFYFDVFKKGYVILSKKIKKSKR